MGLLISELTEGSSFKDSDLIAIEQELKTVSISLDQLKGEVFASYNAVDNIANYSISTIKLERISPNTLLGNVSDSNNKPTEVNIVSDISLGTENNILSGAAVKDALDNATLELAAIAPKTVLGNLQSVLAAPSQISILEDLNDSPLPATIPSSSGVKSYVDMAVESAVFPPIDEEDFIITSDGNSEGVEELALQLGHPEWDSSGKVNISVSSTTTKYYNSLLTVQGTAVKLNNGPKGYTNPASLSFKTAIWNGDQSSDTDSGGLFIGTNDNNNDEYALYIWDENRQKNTFGIKASTGDVEVFGRHSIMLDTNLVVSTQTFGDVLNKLRMITPVKYVMTNEYENGSNFVYNDNVARNLQYGFDISEFETQFPDLVNYDLNSSSEGKHYKGIDLIRYTSVLTKGIQELDTRISSISTEEYGQIIINNDWANSTSTNKLYINRLDWPVRKLYDPYTPTENQDSNTNFTVQKSDIGLLITNDNSEVNGPEDVGICLYNDDSTPGAFAPMITFAKREYGTSEYKTATAAIYSRSIDGTMPDGAWIDGELIFATAGYDPLDDLYGEDSNNGGRGLSQRMVIDRNGQVGINTNAPTEVLDPMKYQFIDPTEDSQLPRIILIINHIVILMNNFYS